MIKKCFSQSLNNDGRVAFDEKQCLTPKQKERARKNIGIDEVTGIPEAPADGVEYARKNKGWVPVSGGGQGTVKGIYESVDAMKADTSLQTDDIVQTKRFYSIQQRVFDDDAPGGCTYRIIASLSGTDSEGLGMDIIQLNNGKYAKAQLFNEAMPEQLGYQLKYGPVNGVDLTPYINRLARIGVTTIRLNRTGHIGSGDNAHAVYRIKDMCSLERSIKIIGVHDSASGYSTRVYLTPSADNTEHVMFDCKQRMIELKDMILMNVQSDRYDKSVCIRISAGQSGATSSAGYQFERLNIQGFKYGIYGSSGFYWHDSFIHLNMASNYVNVRLERLAYTTKFYNCLFNVPKYRSVEVGSPFTLEFDTCNFGVDGDCDTLLHVERWYSPNEIPPVNERDGEIRFVNSQMEYEINNKPIAKDNKHIFVYVEDDAITKINCKNCCFIITPFARQLEYSCRWFSLGPNGYMNIIDSMGPLSDVDIQPGTASANYFLEKDFDKLAFDETRPCRKTINAIQIENSFGFNATALMPDSHLSAVRTDSNMILTTNDTDMKEYYKTPQGTQFLNLDEKSFQTYVSDKMVNFNFIPGNYVRIGDELYEYVVIDGLKWITRNLNLRTPNRQCTFWNHLEFGQYYNNRDIVNVQAKLPSGWRIPTDADIASLVGDGSAARSRSLQSTNYQSVWPNATNSTGFNMVPCHYWKRPSQAAESNFNRGFIFGQAVSNGRRNIDFKENAISIGGWGTSDLTNLYVPVRVCAD